MADRKAQKEENKMRTKISKTMVMVFIGFVALLVMTPKAEALEPRLLWKKELKFDATSVGFARNTGDVIVGGKYARRIILFDKNGNERFHWGPRIDRQPHSVGITDDGRYFIYESGWTHKFKEKMKKEDWDHRIHYVQKNGKELWNKPFSQLEYTYPVLSPDGKYIAFAGAMGEGGDIELWDSAGKRLWIKDAPASEDLKFSPDSKYIVADWGGLLNL